MSMAQFLNVEEVLKAVHIEGAMQIADLGCGPGYFAIPFARLLQEGGRVYAFDVQQSMLEAVRAKAKLEHLYNIETFWTDLEKVGATKLKDDTMDLVLLANILFQAEEKEEILREAHRILRRDGVAIIVEWDESQSVLGPPGHARVGKTFLGDLMKQVGFHLLKEFPAGKYHYGLVFKKA